MGTWSISPDTGLVSIDNTGKLTYQEHTEDTNYTISYTDSDCGTITKNITVKACTPTDISVKLIVSFTNNKLVLNKLPDSFSVAVGGAQIKYEKTDGTYGYFDLSELVVGQLITLKKEDFDSEGMEGTKYLSGTIPNFRSIVEISSFGDIISIGGSRNSFGDECFNVGGDFFNNEAKSSEQSYVFPCNALTCNVGDALTITVSGGVGSGSVVEIRYDITDIYLVSPESCPLY